MRFLDVFLLHCLLADSPPDSPQEIAALARNQNRVAARGREPGLKLERRGEEVPLDDWAAEVLAELTPLAAALDAAHGGEAHALALQQARELLRDPERLPSARVLRSMREDFDHSHRRFVLAQSIATRRHLLDLPWSAEDAARAQGEAAESIADRDAVLAADTLPFEQYRQQFLAPHRLSPKRSAGGRD
jgi:glutamate--cysteine ligase